MSPALVAPLSIVYLFASLYIHARLDGARISLIFRVEISRLVSLQPTTRFRRAKSVLCWRRRCTRLSTPVTSHGTDTAPGCSSQDAQLAALHLVSERARPKLRVLCLHGYLQNSQVSRPVVPRKEAPASFRKNISECVLLRFCGSQRRSSPPGILR